MFLARLSVETLTVKEGEEKGENLASDLYGSIHFSVRDLALTLIALEDGGNGFQLSGCESGGAEGGYWHVSGRLFIASYHLIHRLSLSFSLPLSLPVTEGYNHQGVIWSGLGISVLFVSIRLFARFKVFGRLYADDAIVIFALSLALASAIVSQIFAESLFQLMLVLGGRRLPSPSFVADSEGFLKASLAVIIFYYSTLWAIKISFLVFFKRLIKNVRRQELMWWPIFGFTMATYFVCMGIIPYNCLVSPLQQSMVICTKDSAVRFQRISLISICVWDVVTDFLSQQSCFVLG